MNEIEIIGPLGILARHMDEDTKDKMFRYAWTKAKSQGSTNNGRPEERL